MQAEFIRRCYPTDTMYKASEIALPRTTKGSLSLGSCSCSHDEETLALPDRCWPFQIAYYLGQLVIIGGAQAGHGIPSLCSWPTLAENAATLTGSSGYIEEG